MYRNIPHFGAFFTSPTPYGGTLPKGEGRAAAQLIHHLSAAAEKDPARNGRGVYP